MTICVMSEVMGLVRDEEGRYMAVYDPPSSVPRKDFDVMVYSTIFCTSKRVTKQEIDSIHCSTFTASTGLSTRSGCT
jgi:hypothetical protein